MKTHSRIVVIGGGMMGVSLLYHLAKDGCTDSLLIEKHELTSGSTWHAAGQCPSITGSFNLAKIHAYGNWLYPRLESLTGQYVSWHASGGLRLATNQRELDWLKNMSDWMISKKRFWGLALPIWVCGECAQRWDVVVDDNKKAGRNGR